MSSSYNIITENSPKLRLGFTDVIVKGLTYVSCYLKVKLSHLPSVPVLPLSFFTSSTLPPLVSCAIV